MEDTTTLPPFEETLARLRQFREQVYCCFKREADALQNLGDALLTECQASSLVQLSLSPFFARQWPSLYKALSRGKIDEEQLRRVLVTTLLSHLPEDEPIFLAVDGTPLPRPDAETSEDRGYVHLPDLPLVKNPIGIGWQYSKIVFLPSTVSSWVLPLDLARIPTSQTPIEVAIAQLTRLKPLFGKRRVIVTADRGYCSAAFLRALKDLGYGCLVRMKSDRNLYRPGVRIHARGPVPKDGPVFQGKRKETHGEPQATVQITDAKGNRVHVRRFAQLHFKEDRDLSVQVIQIEREGAKGTKWNPKDCWLVTLDDTLPLASIPGHYACRFSIEHGLRFYKQDLLWGTAHIRTPEQFQRWTCLVALVMTQLCLARPLGQVGHRPWERKNRPVTPAQVRRLMPVILVQLGTPARDCRPRGIAPGRSMGFRPSPAPRFPVVRKHPKKEKKSKPPPEAAA